MKTLIKLHWLLVFVIFIPTVAKAVPVKITFEGTVFASQDDANFFKGGIGKDTILNAAVQSTYIFDTASIPTTDANPNSHITDYRDGTDWVKATTSLVTSTDNFTFTDEFIADPDIYQDRLYIQDDDLNGGKMEYVHLLSYSRDFNPDNALNQSVTFWDFNELTDTINSNDPTAAINLLNPALWGNGIGMIEYITKPDSTTLIASWAQFEITSVDITIDVPEPSTLALIVFGLAGISFTRRRRSIA